MIRVSFKVLCAIFLILLTSCNDNTKRIAYEFQEKTVEITRNLVGYSSGVYTPMPDIDGKKVLIMYYSPKECSVCAVKHIWDFEVLYEMAEEYDYEMLSVFSPGEDDYSELLEYIKLSEFPYPIYYDINSDFARKNTCIPEDSRFHIFLLDEDRHPVFMGNPLANEKMKEIFNQVMLKK